MFSTCIVVNKQLCKQMPGARFCNREESIVGCLILFSASKILCLRKVKSPNATIMTINQHVTEVIGYVRLQEALLEVLTAH